MSWGVYILRFEGIPSLEAMASDNFQPLSLGSLEELRSKISNVFPHVDWKDPAWGSLDENDYSIEFPLQKDQTDGMMLIVRGSGNPVPAIADLCRQNGWSAIIDDQLMDLQKPSISNWVEWQAYRDQIVGD